VCSRVRAFDEVPLKVRQSGSVDFSERLTIDHASVGHLGSILQPASPSEEHTVQQCPGKVVAHQPPDLPRQG
jgi:hypothetical protein